MTNIGDIAGGIVLGGFLILVGGVALEHCAGNHAKKQFKNPQTIAGVVIEENYENHFIEAEYNVAIRTAEGKKVLVHYSSAYSGLYEPQVLNTLFASGDRVELNVATYNEFGGDQRFVGLAGKLAECKE